VPTAIDISCVIICPQDIVTKVQRGSFTGKSGNITILTKRAEGSSAWLTTEVGGAWMPADKHVRLCNRDYYFLGQSCDLRQRVAGTEKS